MSRVRDEIGERGEAEAEESAWVWSFGRGGNGSGTDVGLNAHFLVASSSFQFPPHFKIPVAVTRPLVIIVTTFQIGEGQILS